MTTILDTPAPIAMHLAEFSLGWRDNLAEDRSDFSLAEQRLDFGAEIWIATLTTTILDADQAQMLGAFLRRLRQPSYAWRLGAPDHAVDLGDSTAATLTLTADLASMARNVPVAGIGAGKRLEVGRFVSIGDRMHQLIEGADGDAATLVVTPRLREAAQLGAAVKPLAADVKSIWRVQGVPEFRTRLDGRFEPVKIALVEAVKI